MVREIDETTDDIELDIITMLHPEYKDTIDTIRRTKRINEQVRNGLICSYSFKDSGIINNLKFNQMKQYICTNTIKGCVGIVINKGDIITKDDEGIKTKDGRCMCHGCFEHIIKNFIQIIPLGTIVKWEGKLPTIGKVIGAKVSKYTLLNSVDYMLDIHGNTETHTSCNQYHMRRATPGEVEHYNNCDKTTTRRNYLIDNYRKLKRSYKQLQDDYKQLQDEYEELQKEYNDLSDRHDKLTKKSTESSIVIEGKVFNTSGTDIYYNDVLVPIDNIKVITKLQVTSFTPNPNISLLIGTTDTKLISLTLDGFKRLYEKYKELRTT